MVCLSPVGYGVKPTFRALALRRSRRLCIFQDNDNSLTALNGTDYLVYFFF